MRAGLRRSRPALRPVSPVPCRGCDARVDGHLTVNQARQRRQVRTLPHSPPGAGRRLTGSEKNGTLAQAMHPESGDDMRILRLLLALCLMPHVVLANTVVLEAEATYSLQVTSTPCQIAGGEVVGGVCRFNQALCPTGWSQAENWGTFPSKTCSHWSTKTACQSNGTKTNYYVSPRSWSNNATFPSITMTNYWVVGPSGCMSIASAQCRLVAEDRTQVGCLKN